MDRVGSRAYRIVWFVVAALLSTTLARAEAPNWVVLEPQWHAPNGTTVRFEIDTRNVRAKGDFVKAWRRATCLEGRCDYSFVVTLFLIDCVENTRLSLDGYLVDKEGARYQTEPGIAPEPNIPGSPHDMWRGALCKKSAPE